MAAQRSRMYSLLFLILLSVVLFIFLSEHLSRSWTTFTEKNKHRRAGMLLGSNIIFWKEKGNSAPPPAALSTTYTAKMAELKTDPIKTSRSFHDSEAETPMPVLYKKSFKRFPQWDFEDVYNQDAPPRKTSCAQSLRNSEDERFQKAFLPNMRLYLHKGNINMSEWNRLSHFNNPFGFMEYKFEDVMASVTLIPKPNEPLLLPKPGSGGCVHCAVVGTAGILNGSKMGKEIDSHDYVFRMNGAVIKGYEEDVGNKTSVYVHTAHSITSSHYGLQQYGYTSVPNDEGIKFVLIPEGMRDFEWLQGLLKGERLAAGTYINERPREFYAGQYNESRFYVLHQDFLRYVRNRFIKSQDLNATYWSIVRPTNGAFTLFLALHTCDTVDAYGFMTKDYHKYPNYYFERDVKTSVIFYGNHDYILEMKTWKRLHDSKIIKLYQRTDSKTETEK